MEEDDLYWTDSDYVPLGDVREMLSRDNLVSQLGLALLMRITIRRIPNNEIGCRRPIFDSTHAPAKV